VACELDGVVYLYLYGCRPALVDTALANVFHLSFGEMFSEHMVYATSGDIRAQYARMRQTLAGASSQSVSTALSDEPLAQLMHRAKDIGNEELAAMAVARPLQPVLGVFPGCGAHA